MATWAHKDSSALTWEQGVAGRGLWALLHQGDSSTLELMQGWQAQGHLGHPFRAESCAKGAAWVSQPCPEYFFLYFTAPKHYNFFVQEKGAQGWDSKGCKSHEEDQQSPGRA